MLIVGGGPTGMTLAAGLRMHGIEPLVVERRAAPAQTSRAAVIHARTLEVLEPLDVTPHLPARGLRCTNMHVRERDRILLSLDFTSIPSAYPFVLSCPQNVTEAILYDRLTELGGEVHRAIAAKTIAELPADRR